MFAFQNKNLLHNVQQVKTVVPQNLFRNIHLNLVGKAYRVQKFYDALVESLKSEGVSNLPIFKGLQQSGKNSTWVLSENLSFKVIPSGKGNNTCSSRKGKEAVLSVAFLTHNSCNARENTLSSVKDESLPPQKNSSSYSVQKLEVEQEILSETASSNSLNSSTNYNLPLQNKNSFYITFTGKPWYSGNIKCNFQVQSRGFKTRRNIQLELEQNSLASLNLTKNDEKSEKNTTNVVNASKHSEVVEKLLKVYKSLGLLIALLIGFALCLFSNNISWDMTNYEFVEKVDVTFDDIKGIEEAKEELKLIVELLQNPEKFQKLGGKLPSGVLIEGSPGTGKTLLAKAIAGEAKVPFFFACGSEFDELIVGRGACRIRKLFKEAKERAPSVIFIDEIDAIGGKRISSSIHAYANQSINQLLSEMDGFVNNPGVIVIGATNRIFDLDNALLRPGRFDLKISLQLPTAKERAEILQLYLDKVPNTGIDVDSLVKKTREMTGADISNLVNQAALRAAVCNSDTVTNEHMDYAFSRILLGPERKSLVLDEETARLTAFHEIGHALVAYYSRVDSMPLKVTIIPRNESLGHTQIAENEKLMYTKADYYDLISIALGGRAGEEVAAGTDKITSGCYSDMLRATDLATKMVRSFGMSEKAGLRTYEGINLGRGNFVTDWADSSSAVMDNEIKNILDSCYNKAKEILKQHADEHKFLAEALLERESMDLEDIKRMIEEAQKMKKKK